MFAEDRTCSPYSILAICKHISWKILSSFFCLFFSCTFLLTPYLSLLSHPHGLLPALHLSSLCLFVCLFFLIVTPLFQAISSCITPSHASQFRMMHFPHVLDHPYCPLKLTPIRTGSEWILSCELHSGHSSQWPSQTHPDVIQIRKEGKRYKLEFCCCCFVFWIDLSLYSRAKSLTSQHLF